jgi:creatinine amidohydrolase
MRVADLNWMQLEAYLEHDDRIALPLGSTEQHAYLSLATDVILAERVAVEAAEPLGVPVLPPLAFGVAPYFAAFPGSLTLAEETYTQVLRELIASLQGQGFGRILLVNGHGGNSEPAAAALADGVALHDWWRAPRTWALVQELDPDASHASWIENFPWTRLPGVTLPAGHKRPGPRDSDDPAEVRRQIGDGSYGGDYARPEEDVQRVWACGVEETRNALLDIVSKT